MAKPPGLPIDVTDLNLTQREIQFIGHYSVDMDALKAYRSARYVDKSVSDVEANVRALQLLNEPRIREGVRRVGAAALEPYRDALYNKMLRFLDQRAFFNVKDFFTDSGKPKALSEIPEHALVAVDQVVEDFKGKDGDVRVVKLSLANRMEAIKKIQEILKETAPVKEEKKGGLSETHMDELSGIFSRLQVQNAAESATMGTIAGFQAGMEAQARAQGKGKPSPVPVQDPDTIEMPVESTAPKELPEPTPRNIPEFANPRRERVVRERTLKAADEV